MAANKTPNSVLERRGSKKVRDEPDPRQGTVEPTFRLCPEAQKAWRRICVELDAIGALSPTFAEAMTIAATAVGNIEIATRDLEERGHISVTERGETKNPSFTILTSSQQMAHRYLSTLGLTPTAIGNLKRKPDDETNEFDEL